jgi:hypothetical protein
MLNKSHESKLSAFGLDRTIDRWNRVYYVYPDAILGALRKGNQKGQTSRTINTDTGQAAKQNTYLAANGYQLNEALINEAAGHVLSQMSASANQQPQVAEQTTDLPVDQAELIRNAQASVDAAHNWVPGQPSVAAGGQFPIAQQFADQASVETSAPLTEAQLEQQQLIRYAQQGVDEAHDWLSGQSSTEFRL